jgi:hypothetical protein
MRLGVPQIPAVGFKSILCNNNSNGNNNNNNNNNNNKCDELVHTRASRSRGEVASWTS